jgi:5-formyltetrahydrofolate cyclo-ligase
VPSTITTDGAIAVQHHPRPADLLDPRPVKQAMRARIRAERRGRHPSRREADAHALAALVLELPELATANCIAAYASTPDEPGTTPLRHALHRSGIRVLLPVVLPDGHLDWATDHGDLRPTTAPGGPEPTGDRLGLEGIGLAQLIIIPALAVDTLGNRLGQGAGYYDRTLRLVDPTVPILALVHESEILDAAVEPVPTEAHDLPVDAVITPHRCLRLPHHRR